MKGTADPFRIFLRDQRGNTIIIMTTVCLLLLMVTLAGLDIFSILISRRFAETDADAAATGAARQIQPLVARAYAEAVNDKLQQWKDEALAEWRGKAPTADPQAYVLAWLASHISDQEVLAYLAGQTSEQPEAQKFVMAILTPQEQGCVLMRIAVTARDEASQRAQQFIRDPQVTSLAVQFPYEDRLWVMVRAQREIPTTLVGRLFHYTPKVEVWAGATIRGMADLTVGECR